MNEPPQTSPDSVCDGDSESNLFLGFEVLVSPLYAWAKCRIPLNLRGNLEPEEILQETWLRTLTHSKRFDSLKGTFRQWVFGVARLVLAELVREHGDHRVRERLDERSFRLAARITSASRRAARNEEVSALIRALHEFSESDRHLVFLRGLEGQSHEEVAAALESTVPAIRKRWQRLRERLQEVGVQGSFLEQN